MKKPDTWMPMYWSKFFVDTTNFDDAQTGAYTALLGHCWIRGGWLPDDNVQLARWARCTPARWRKHRMILGQEPYFVVAAGRWTQKRLTKEFSKAAKMVTAKSEAGKAGANERWQKDGRGNSKQDGRRIADAMADGMANRCVDDAPLHKPEPSPKAKTEAKTTREPPSAFAPPEWVPRQEWDDFDEMRRSKSGKGWTFNAKGLAVNELEKLKAAGHDIAAVLRQSTMRTYAGLFPVESKGKQTVADKRSATAKAMYAHRKDDADDDIPGDAERVD